MVLLDVFYSIWTYFALFEYKNNAELKYNFDHLGDFYVSSFKFLGDYEFRRLYL